MKKKENNKNLLKEKKYWYLQEIYTCVLCGHEKVIRTRVHNEKEKGRKFFENACSEHFI